MSAPPDSSGSSPQHTTPVPSFGSTAGAPQPASASAWLVAAGVVLLLVACIFLLTRHRGSAAAGSVLPLDSYAAQLPISDIVMSESTSLSGGKSTFIDGKVRNTGSKLLTAATLQVLFAHDDGMPPQVETLPLSLIRTRQPYVDTESLDRAPLAPGAEREFRLIFENIGQNWNQALPEIRVVKVQGQP